MKGQDSVAVFPPLGVTKMHKHRTIKLKLTDVSTLLLKKQDRDNDNRLKFIAVRLKICPDFDTATYLKCYKYFENNK